MTKKRVLSIVLEVAVAVLAIIVLPTQSRDSRLIAQIHRDGGQMVSTLTDMNVTVDKIEYRSDLTRVYATMNGNPNRAQRIDAVKLLAGMHREYDATDIDGVDFKRWFQWDDSGVIKLEIDFPPIKRTKKITLFFDTPKGAYKVEFRPQ